MQILRRFIALCLLSSFTLILSLPLGMQKAAAEPVSSGVKFGTSAVQGGSGAAWTNPNNILADDNAYTDVNPNYSQTQHIDVTGFDFSGVPDGASIEGVEIEMDGDTLGSGNFYVYLYYNGSTIGTTQITPASVTLGGDADTLGATLNTTIVKDSTFGIRILVDGGEENVTMDSLSMTVYYTDPPTVSMAITNGKSSPAGDCGWDHTVSLATYEMTFTFSEAVTGFAVGDISVSGGGSAANFATVSSTVYTADITPSGLGNHTVTIAADAATSTATSAGNVANADTVYYAVGWVGCCGVIYLDCTNALTGARRSGTNSVIVHDNTTGFPVAELSIDSSTADATLLSNLTISHNSANNRTVLHTAQGHTGLNGTTAKLFVPRVGDGSVTYCEGLTDSSTACDSSWPNRAVWTNSEGTVSLTGYFGTMTLAKANALTVTRTTAKDSSCVDQNVWSIQGTISSGGQDGGGGGVPEFTWWSTLLLLIGGGYLIHKLFDEELPLFLTMGY